MIFLFICSTLYPLKFAVLISFFLPFIFSAAESSSQIFQIFCPGAGSDFFGMRGWSWQCSCWRGLD